MHRFTKTLVFLSAVLAACAGPAAAEDHLKPPAFPGAKGFGAETRGGRGGEVIFVDNLNDSGPGSLRDAVESAGPRTVIFRVSGTIHLEKKLGIREPFITIAGQTAPGDGVCLAGYQLDIQADEVIVRYLRVRVGNDGPGERDAITIRDAKNVILDHSSASWGVDELVSTTHSCNVTVQWCIISEALHEAGHHKGNHGYGSLVRGRGISYHHNLYTHNRSRNPRVGEGQIECFSNVIYNWDGMAAYAGDERHALNFTDNYFKPGPDTQSNPHLAYHAGGPANRIYFDGNLLESARDVWLDDDEILSLRRGGKRMDKPFAFCSNERESAVEAYERVLDSAGAVLPRRDVVDRRVVESVRRGKGKQIDSHHEVGGWPSLASDRPAADADRDGMPDAWEDQYRLDLSDPSDSAGDLDRDGYTNLEEFLNATNPREADLE